MCIVHIIQDTLVDHGNHLLTIEDSNMIPTHTQPCRLGHGSPWEAQRGSLQRQAQHWELGSSP